MFITTEQANGGAVAMRHTMAVHSTFAALCRAFFGFSVVFPMNDMVVNHFYLGQIGFAYIAFDKLNQIQFISADGFKHGDFVRRNVVVVFKTGDNDVCSDFRQTTENNFKRFVVDRWVRKELNVGFDQRFFY